jgi:hypothetical protein
MSIPLYPEDIPSRRIKLIEAACVYKIEKMVRFSWCPVDEAIKEYEIDKTDVFSLTAGPLLIYLNSGLVIGVSSNPSLNSVVLWVEKNENGDAVDDPTELDDELFPVEADNDWIKFAGKTIASFKILRKKVDSAKLAELPNEVGVIIEMNDGNHFILSHGLHDNSDDFSVITKKQIDPELMDQIDGL